MFVCELNIRVNAVDRLLIWKSADKQTDRSVNWGPALWPPWSGLKHLVHHLLGTPQSFHGVQFQGMVHNVPHGAQVPLILRFYMTFVFDIWKKKISHRTWVCVLWTPCKFLILWCTNATEEVQTDRQGWFHILDCWQGRNDRLIACTCKSHSYFFSLHYVNSEGTHCL